MWVLNAIILHLLLLGTIFVIYFRSPVITRLQPQQSLSSLGLEAPAKRLVLIVTDGLRAESFFHANCSDVPNLRDLFLQKGLVGVSHTHVPTESRPGHIALIAGLYEDPSAVTRGWKENPIDFDTLFHRSSYTYAWGANDVLHIFSRLSGGSRLIFDAYDHELDFSGSENTYALDEWVFERVRLFLKRKKEDLRKQKEVVFFLHLLGLDSAGHIHKPGSPLFLDNLHRTERGIKEIYELFESTFPDGRTAYILTSDHGMTNAGSHGSGDPLETETPFFIWGSGIAANMKTTRSFRAADAILPLYALEQAQMAPLMAALIGIPPPLNNFGKLPRGYMNVSLEYVAHATHNNAQQLLAQFKALLVEHERGFFAGYLRSYVQLNLKLIANYEQRMQERFKNADYEHAISASYEMMDLALEGIDYYHGYYRHALLLSTTLTFLGWLYYLLQLLVEQPNKVARLWRPSAPLLAVFFLLLTFSLLQRVSFAVGFYLTLPVFVWMLAVQQQQLSLAALGKLGTKPLLQFLLLILCAELLVFSFFERRLISLGFLLFAAASSYRSFVSKQLKFALWLVLVLILASFPLLPSSLGYTNLPLLLLGMLFTLVRPFLVKSRLSLSAKLISSICLLNAMLCAYQHSHQLGVYRISQLLSWLFLIYAFAAIIFDRSSVGLKQRLELIFLNLTTLYALFCTSYEQLFTLMLASELMLALSSLNSQLPAVQLDQSELAYSKKSMPFSRRLQSSFQLAFSILLYTFFSFFGTGNIASISSFDPNIIRCFLTTFSPFIIMALVILKLAIPVILNISIIFGLSEFARAHERQIFICLLLVCDVMGLNFLFLVRNRGSWLEIGTSISHFVIMEVTTLVLLLLTQLAKLLLGLRVMPEGAFKLK